MDHTCQQQLITAKGRARIVGERHPRAKLTVDMVAEILEARENRKDLDEQIKHVEARLKRLRERRADLTNKSLAKKYDVARSLICKIMARQVWKFMGP